MVLPSLTSCSPESLAPMEISSRPRLVAMLVPSTSLFTSALAAPWAAACAPLCPSPPPPCPNTSHDSFWSSGSRSEEHTSELQSLMRISYAVFCLQKKKDKNTQEASI